MAGKKQLLLDVEYFLTGILGEYKQTSLKVEAEATIKYMFKKKNYMGNVKEFQKQKEDALRIDTAKYDVGEDEKALDLIDKFERALAMFNVLCDSSIDFQNYLYQKSVGIQNDRRYKDVVKELRKVNSNVQLILTELDATYGQFRAQNPGIMDSDEENPDYGDVE